MLKSISEMETALRSRICGVCSDRSEPGVCGLDNPDRCILFSLFPEVAKAIIATGDSNEGRDYIASIKAHVCTMCGEQAMDGSCEAQVQVRCALDAYLPKVIEAVEYVTGRKLSRTGLAEFTPVQLAH